MKFKVAAEVSVRPVESFDAASGGWCMWHRTNDATHMGTVLIEGHTVMVVALCAECASLMEHGTDWRGSAARRNERELMR